MSEPESCRRQRLVADELAVIRRELIATANYLEDQGEHENYAAMRVLCEAASLLRKSADKILCVQGG